MQPRRSWVSRSSSETNAPRRNATPGTSGNSGGARPQSAASMARRASASSAARSAGVSSGSAMVWLAATDQRDEARALGNRPQDPRLILHLMLLDLRVVAQPLQILVTHGAERGVLHAPHRDDAVAHHAYMPRNRCIAATRSTATM